MSADKPDNLPYTIRKAELMQLLRLTNYYQLTNIFVTDGVLTALDIEYEQYRRIRQFSARQTRIIYECFGWRDARLTIDKPE